jgi:hypothetical protein
MPQARAQTRTVVLSWHSEKSIDRLALLSSWLNQVLDTARLDRNRKHLARDRHWGALLGTLVGQTNAAIRDDLARSALRHQGK